MNHRLKVNSGSQNPFLISNMKSLNLESLERMGDYEWMDRIRAGKQFSPSIKVGKLLLH